MSSDNPQSNYAIELPEDAVRRACRKIYEALEAYWEELNREGCFADFVASVERAADIEDERLRAAWVAAVSVEAAWANVETNSSRTVAARSVEAARANEETNSNGMAALGDLLEALDAWEQHLSYAWYCVGLMRGPARGLTPTDLSRRLLNFRHKEGRDGKRMVQEYYLNHLKPMGLTKTDAVEKILEARLVLQQRRTIRDWLTNL